MIKNKSQHDHYLKEIKFIEDSLSDIKNLIAKHESNIEHKIQEINFEKQLHKIKKELTEYETLVSDKLSVLEFDSFVDDMNKAIMSFRIASKYSQKDLADLMYLQPQQISRYEEKDYMSAAFERILQLLKALDVQIILKKKLKPIQFTFSLEGEAFTKAQNFDKLVKENKQILRAVQ